MAQSITRVHFSTQILTEFDVFQVSGFVDALYDTLNQEDWWDQEITQVTVTLGMTKAPHRRGWELFTVCENLAFLLPQRLYQLHVISANQRDSHARQYRISYIRSRGIIPVI